MRPPPQPSPHEGGNKKKERVYVEPPIFEVDDVRELLDGLDVVVEAPPRPWAAEDVVALLIWQPLTKEDMDRLPALKAVVTGSIGFDHIDLEEARRRQIWVCNTPDYCVDEVADTTMAMLLSLARGVTVLDRAVRDGKWDDHAAGVLPRIADLKLGIIGFGRIGRAVARRALSLGIETWATDPLVPAAAIRAAGVKPATMDELLSTVTAVTLHLPFTAERAYLIGERELSLMPRGSYLLNTARGQLVDTDAVLQALDNGRLGGAALDVLEIEPPSAGHLPPRHPRLVVTPHAAWLSPNSEREAVRRATLALRGLFEGQEPPGVVVSGGPFR